MVAPVQPNPLQEPEQQPEPKPDTAKKPFKLLVCVTTDENGVETKTNLVKPSPSSTLSSSSASQTSSQFETRAKDLLESIRSKYSDLCSAYVIVTTKHVHLLKMAQNPVNLFLGFAMQGQMKQADTICQAFSLEKLHLLELAGDLRLAEGDISTAVSLYRQSGSKQLKTALKLASSGNVAELLSFLQVVFCSRSLEVSQAERIHLSNLALLAYCQQTLTKPTLSRDHFDACFLSFLTQNIWYDPSLAVRQLLETSQYNLLASLATVRGLEQEVGRGLALHLQQASGHSAGLLESYFQGLSPTDRHGLVSCLLLPDLLSSLLSEPSIGRSLARALAALLPCLSPSQLTAVLHASCPARLDLQPLLHPTLYEDAAEGTRPFASALLELFCLACLTLLRAKAEAGSSGPSYHSRLLRPIAEPQSGDPGVAVSSCVLAAGYAHSLLLGRASLTSWGAAASGCLGQGPPNTSSAQPSQVPLFQALPGLRVAQVAAGKQHSLALTEAGVYAWGDNRFGQLGVGKAVARSSTPRLVPGLGRAVGVACGQFHSLARDAEGRVMTWGWGVHGQLGLGGIEDSGRPMLVRALANHRVVSIVAGYAHSVVLTSQGKVFTFGCGLFGQLGTGGTTKAVLPVQVLLPGPCNLLSSGYFHCVAGLAQGGIMLWGNNPQVLRLEAQQRKKERQAARKAEEKRLEEEEVERGLREAAEEEGCGERIAEEELHSSSFPSISQPLIDPASEIHLTPQPMELPHELGPIASVACGSQHTVLLSRAGRLYSFGRSLEGQLGIGTRTSTKVPTLVTALQDDCVLAVAAGADFTMALTDSGTVFGWGSNTSGQLGKPPVDVEGKGENNKVLVMKTTKRVIRLQHGLQNSCDVPKPVQGLTKTGVYSEEVPDSASPAFANFYSRLQRGNAFPPVEPFFHSQQLQTFLHTTIEVFPDVLDTGKLLRKCLMLENPLAAAKISLGNQKVLQAFDLSLQAVLKTEQPSSTDGESTCDKIFHCFLFYCSQPSASAQERADLFERLVACWQDRGSSLHRLEKMLLDAADQDLLHTIIYSLFCPSTEGETDLSQGPGKRNGE